MHPIDPRALPGFSTWQPNLEADCRPMLAQWLKK